MSDKEVSPQKPKPKYRLKPVREGVEESNVQPAFSASKPTVRNAPRRKLTPSQEQAKQQAKSSRKPSDKTPVQAPKTLKLHSVKGSKSPSFPEKGAKSNPTNADTEIVAEKTVDQLLREVIGPLGLQLENVDAKLKGRRPKLEQLSPKTLAQIVLMMRAGAYHQDASRAAGITPKTWNAWLRRGEDDYEKNKSTAYCSLFLLISKAVGEALVVHSVRAVADDPKFFLTHGPGKSRPGREGWSPSIKIEGGTDPIQVEHNHQGTIEIEGSPHLNISLGKPEGADLLANALAGLTEIGIAIPKQLLESAKPAIDAEISKAVKQATKNAR